MATAAKQGTASVYTIGHSVHSLPRFLDLLSANDIALVVDTRGRPYSRWNPQFNREPFAAALELHSVGYLWLGDSLAGRPQDKRLYGADGKPDWARVIAAPGFAPALDRVMAEAVSRPVAILCAEEDPLRCHRRFLLTPPLIERGASVLHIRGDGHVESEEALCARDCRPQLDLFGH
jgi:uncharacterized protein (DUF488 family)